MAEASIPVDLFNPGQVFACLGFLEAADILLGDAEGGFAWEDGEARFILRALGERNPFEVVLEFLASADPMPFAPMSYTDSSARKSDHDDGDAGDDPDEDVTNAAKSDPDQSATFCAKQGDRMSLPIRIGGGNRPIVELSHWADGSGRECFKLYAGNRSAHKIARAMLKGVYEKPTIRQQIKREPGALKYKGVAQLWGEGQDILVRKPFHALTLMGGSFNFDPRGAWAAIDAGYSPNKQKHAVEASPVVEVLAAWGLENARPDEFEPREVSYSVWGALTPPALARAALAGAIPSLPNRRFQFRLGSSGKNSVVTFAQEEILS